MNVLLGSPPLIDVVGSWPASLALLSVVVFNGIVGVNVLSRCTPYAGGVVTRAIFGSDSIFVSGTVSTNSPG